ncbi:hypothetical protein P175DRAFT_0527810 [Aspergillus ochraceoroseus IBT 24754]|uniref:Uncharacterized protein n=1 Tax=Aspergillus ochraceoroseus IBT 24754 TaxID=1392256 RepID=A0A2T5M733_9EURO|nr:uncharacterized protein P175DRAFT_0527810 [Aspergillus ochraceoroseus IBT 24754]PTU24348.1 hypothetical protein P175DRAFT_0527810 [Aspergillus ochraceoroseus IBT 24754]
MECAAVDPGARQPILGQGLLSQLCLQIDRFSLYFGRHSRYLVSCLTAGAKRPTVFLSYLVAVASPIFITVLALEHCPQSRSGLVITYNGVSGIFVQDTPAFLEFLFGSRWLGPVDGPPHLYPPILALTALFILS